MSEVVLIDFSSISVPIWKMSGAEPDPNHCKTQIVATVRRLASGQPSVALCCDSGKSFRNELSADYKANRPATDEPMIHQFRLAQEALRAEGFPVWSAKGFEADDIIASAAAYYLGRDEETTVVVVSGDKDLYALISPRVRIKSRVGIVDEAGCFEKFGVPPAAMLDFLSLCGDESDNIRGAKGIGPTTAAKLLARFGTLDDLYEDFDKADADARKALGFTPKLAESLEEFATRRDQVRALITLRTDVEMPFEEVFAPRVAAPLAPEDDHGFGSFDDGVEAMPETEQSQDTPIVEGTIEPDTQPAAPQTPPEPLPAKAAPVALVRHADAPQGLVPRNLDEAFRLAKAMHVSRQFSAYGSPEAVMATILAGHELGLQPMAALRSVHIIEGKPSLSADLIRAMAMKHPECRYFRCTERVTEPGKERATFVTQRGDDPPTSLTFTLEEARQAWKKDDAAWKKSGWGTYPADMCVARASAKLARLVFPDAVFGVYETDELREVSA